jgi:hypothetical protein
METRTARALAAVHRAYLALRRMGRKSFSSIPGRAASPRKYANKLDYAIKMMEFIDTT